ncbi:MAG: glycosyltransferase [Ignavibacteriales bacterium]|nr:MAG: glycosyltransferase [Ignavibacteriales bacterium]
MKILMFIDGLAMGGKERRMVELVKASGRSDEVEYAIALMNKEIYYKEILDLNIPVFFLIRKIRKDPGIFLKLLLVCRRYKPDIIHVWDSMTAMYAAPIAKTLGIKLINGMITEAPVNLDDVTLKRTEFSSRFSDIMLANSEAGLRSYHISEKKGRFIHNGFSSDRMNNITDPAALRKKYDLKEELVVGIVGALQERKDHKVFIKSAINIIDKRKDVVFIIVGDGPLRTELENFVPSELKSKIKFLGVQTNSESLINIFDIGVLTTNQKIHGEGISNSILEYMALGKPVIATNGGGTPEIVEDGVTGFLVDEDSSEQLTEKIQYLLNQPELRKSMGEAGRKKVKNEFSIEQMVNKTIELYKEVLN